MTSAVVEVLGPVLYVALLAAGAGLLLRSSAARGLLLPVAVGLALRAIVMLVAHVASVETGGHGFMYLDDRGYTRMATAIADEWRAGNLVHPARADLAGAYVFGYPVLVGSVFTLVGKSVIAAKAINVLFSAATVLLLALLAGRLLGDGVRERAAWLAALLPTAVWWSAPMMKEAATAFLAVACLLALTWFFRPRAIAVFAPLYFALAMMRTSAAAAIGLAALAVMVCRALRPPTAAGARRLALATVLLLGIPILSFVIQGAGDAGVVVNAYSSTVENQIAEYRDPALAGLWTPVLVAHESVRSLVAPYPWTFDEAARTWDQSLYPGMWVWYVLYPAALLGFWRWRRRPEAWMIGALVVMYVAANAFSAGFEFRQRSSVEPFIVLLVVAGIASWRHALRVGALALVVVAIGAAVQSRSPLAGTAILLGAALLWALAPRVPRAANARHPAGRRRTVVWGHAGAPFERSPRR